MQRVARYDWPQCRYCGRAQVGDCQPVACLLCGTVQCHGNGSGNGHCNVCYFGWLPGWSGNHGECDRAGCHKPAVGMARKRRVCFDHAQTVKTNALGRTMTDWIAERIAHRNSGKGWEHWMEVAS